MTLLNKLNKSKKTQMVSMVIEINEDGYLASIPGIQGAFAEGDTPHEAIFNCLDVLKMIIEYRQEQNQELNLGEIEFTQNTRLTFTMPIGF